MPSTGFCPSSPRPPRVMPEALRDLRRPVLTDIVVAAILEGLAAALSAAPLVAVVEIGRRLLAGQHRELWPIAFLAIGLLAARLAIYVVSAATSSCTTVLTLADTPPARCARGWPASWPCCHCAGSPAGCRPRSRPWCRTMSRR